MLIIVFSYLFIIFANHHQTATYPSHHHKRALSFFSGPYSVDHLASASTLNATFVNASSIECPDTADDYKCPAILTKEQLKEKLCDYEAIVESKINFIPSIEKSNTKCGSIKLVDKEIVSSPDADDFPRKMAVIAGKNCGLDKLVNETTTTNDNGKTTSDTTSIYLLLRSTIPSEAKLMVVDGSMIDVARSQDMTRQEINQIMRQCSFKREGSTNEQQGKQQIDSTQ